MATDPPTIPARPSTGAAPPGVADAPSGGTGAAPPASHGARAHHSHRFLVASLLALGTIIGLVAIFAVWINRQALNTDNWTTTSSRIIADPVVDEALGNYLVSQLYANVNVSGELQSLLPSDLSGLAGPAAGGLRELAQQVAPQLLASAQVQSAWRQANRAAHKELLTILNGGTKAVSTTNGEVTLNLSTILDQLAQQLGLASQLAAARSKLSGGTASQVRTQAQQRLGITIPPNVGQLTILKAKNLKTAQDIATAIRGLAIVLTILMFACFVAAVWFARGWRRIALRSVGWCGVGLGALVILARRIVGNQVIGGLVSVPTNRPAALRVWAIGTSLLYDIAVAVIVYGLLLVIAAWIAGSTRPAIGLRRAMAPMLREHEVAPYAWTGGVFLLVLIWGPTPAFRQVIPVIGMIILLGLGVYLLRKQTAEEFPDAQLGDTTRRVRAWWAARRAGHHHGAPEANGGGSRLNELERLSSLHDRGVLSDEEFQSEKTLIMSGS